MLSELANTGCYSRSGCRELCIQGENKGGKKVLPRSISPPTGKTLSFRGDLVPSLGAWQYIELRLQVLWMLAAAIQSTTTYTAETFIPAVN